VQSALKAKRKELRNTFGTSSIDLTPSAKEVLEKLENKTQKQTEMILAQEFNYSSKSHEVSELQKDESLRLELIFSKEETQILEQTRALMSHQNPENSWKDLIVLLAKKELKKRLGSKAMQSPKDPVTNEIQSAKGHGANEKESTTPENQQRNATPLRSSKPNHQSTQRRRKYISIQIKRELLKKAQYQCEFVDTSLCRRKMGFIHLLKSGVHNPSFSL
jgi:hypothetical protein